MQNTEKLVHLGRLDMSPKAGAMVPRCAVRQRLRHRRLCAQHRTLRPLDGDAAGSSVLCSRTDRGLCPVSLLRVRILPGLSFGSPVNISRVVAWLLGVGLYLRWSLSSTATKCPEHRWLWMASRLCLPLKALDGLTTGPSSGRKPAASSSSQTGPALDLLVLGKSWI